MVKSSARLLLIWIRKWLYQARTIYSQRRPCYVLSIQHQDSGSRKYRWSVCSSHIISVALRVEISFGLGLQSSLSRINYRRVAVIMDCDVTSRSGASRYGYSPTPDQEYEISSSKSHILQLQTRSAVTSRPDTRMGDFPLFSTEQEATSSPR